MENNQNTLRVKSATLTIEGKPFAAINTEAITNEQEVKAFVCWEDFSKENDLCFALPHDEERLSDDLEEWLEDAFDGYAKIEAIRKWAENVRIYKKDRFEVNLRRVQEFVEDIACEEYGMEEPENVRSIDTILEAVKEFNKEQTWYTTGECIGTLNIVKQVEEFYKENQKEFDNLIKEEMGEPANE